MAHELEELEFRTPLVNFPRQNGTALGLLVSTEWQRRLEALWRYVTAKRRIVSLSASRAITQHDQRAILLCTGTITLTLPSAPVASDSYYFFNNGAGVITIAGTVNGVLNYLLSARYEYAEITYTGSIWIVTAND